MNRERGYALFEMVVVAAIITTLLVIAGLRSAAADRLADATRQNLAAQGRLYLHATTRLQQLGYFGRAQQTGGAIKALMPNPLPPAAIEQLAGVVRDRNFPADRKLPPEHRVFSFTSSTTEVAVTLTLGGVAGDLGDAPPPDVESRRTGGGGWSWTWRATPVLPRRARQVIERLYRP